MLFQEVLPNLQMATIVILTELLELDEIDKFVTAC